MPDRSPSELEKFLKLAHERFRLAADAEAETRKEALDDLKFSVGEQWPAALVSRRTEEGKPVLTMNRLPEHIRQVTNNQRQQRPAIQVSPVGNGASKETADIEQGMIRHIETQSDAEIARDTSFESMVRMGYGYERVIPEYVDENDPDNFDQELKIKRIKDPFTVYFDPTCNEPDYSDAEFCFIIETLTKAQYEAKYPDSELAKASLEDFQSLGDLAADWAREDAIRVAEYFYVEKEYETIKTKGGREKRVVKRKVCWAKINAVEPLEERDWPGKWIPVIPVLGDDLIVDGKRYLAGLVRNAKDPQRAYNYAVSTATQVAGLAPLAPFIAAHDQIADFQAQWEQSNRRQQAVLPYKHIDNVPPPTRSETEPPIQAFVYLLRQADQDLKASTGIYDAALGQKGPDESGKAVLARQKQTDVSTANWSDNLARSTRYEGRVLLDLIPHFYDAPRVQRIINPDGTVQHVGIFNSKKSGMSLDDVKQLEEMKAVKKIFDVGVGRYDVTISVGPSYQTKRQEATTTNLELMKNVPIVQQVGADLIIREMDIPNADMLADRVKKALGPVAQDDTDADSPEALKAKLGALTQQHMQAVQALTEAQQIIQTKKVESDAKKEIVQMQEATKLQMHDLDNKVKITIAEIETKAQETQARMAMEREVWKELHGSAHELGMTGVEHANAKELAATAAVNQAPEENKGQNV